MLMGCSNKMLKLKDKPLSIDEIVKANNGLIDASSSGDFELIRLYIKVGANLNMLAQMDGQH